MKARPNEPFLGTRVKLDQPDANGKPVFGDYSWKTLAEVDKLCENLARGLMAANLCP